MQLSGKASLPATPFELCEWKQATVRFNYRIAADKMFYSVPFQYIKEKVDVRITETTIEIFFNHNRTASHRHLYGRHGQYSTVMEHMPADHQRYLEWNGEEYIKMLYDIKLDERLFSVTKSYLRIVCKCCIIWEF